MPSCSALCSHLKCAVQMGADISMSDAQYGMVQGYAYDFVFGVSMLAWGFIADKFRLNRVYLLVGGCAMTAVTLIMEVRCPTLADCDMAHAVQHPVHDA